MANRDQKWLETWAQVMKYLDDNHRNPSKYDDGNNTITNWLKYNRKRRNAGTMKPEQMEKFAILTERMEQLRRVNQYTDPGYNQRKPTLF